jgi:uncharacterized protein YjbJ (UPF0337 family)
MNKDRVKGMMNEVVGSAKRKVGELADDPSLQVKGMVQQVKGKIENALGKAKGNVSEAIEKAESHDNTKAQQELNNPKTDVKHCKCK